MRVTATVPTRGYGPSADTAALCGRHRLLSLRLWRLFLARCSQSRRHAIHERRRGRVVEVGAAGAELTDEDADQVGAERAEPALLTVRDGPSEVEQRTRGVSAERSRLERVTERTRLIRQQTGEMVEERVHRPALTLTTV